MEVLSDDLVEHILERVPAKSLIRLKRVSKLWKSTIESKSFQKRNLLHRQQYSRVPDVLHLRFFATTCDHDDYTENIPSSSSLVTLVKLPKKSLICSNSCDGLICLYDERNKSIVINPTTRWHRKLPRSKLQKLWSCFETYPCPSLGLGKDKFSGEYILVGLYTSRKYTSLFNQNTITTCEVFDFSSNAWRYVTPSCPYEITDFDEIVYVDGSFYWFTTCEDTKVVSFDLHTETFQVIPKAPFVHRDPDLPFRFALCNLNERLCIYEDKWPNHVIWLFDSDSKTWSEMYSITANGCFPLAVLEEKGKLLLHSSCRHLGIYDSQTKSCDLVFPYDSKVRPLCYYQSLVSI